MVQDFNPEKVLMKAELVFDTLISIAASIFDMKGVKTLEFKYAKTK
jgi:hypothetical protein